MDLVQHFRGARRLVTARAGDTIFREGDAGRFTYVLLDGAADVIVGDTVVEAARAGALLGEMAVVDASPRSATVVAVTDCQLVPIDARQFDLLVRETPEFARHVILVITGRLRRMNERLREAVGEVSVRVETRTPQRH
ncbi:MAG TPA: cyclic nucleotide-binding domain-containing protein [Burkholderiales bacterium]|jgi:CRP-like cAMP-binding protein|nr:cyclic nucleotide-binding domain-containing protein [Burkholderiales bacterium]